MLKIRTSFDQVLATFDKDLTKIRQPLVSLTFTCCFTSLTPQETAWQTSTDRILLDIATTTEHNTKEFRDPSASLTFHKLLQILDSLACHFTLEHARLRESHVCSHREEAFLGVVVRRPAVPPHIDLHKKVPKVTLQRYGRSLVSGN